MLDFLFRKPLRVVILCSGRGSNMTAVIEAIRTRRLKHAKVVRVISDNPDAKALDIAKSYGIPAQYIHPGDFKTKLEGEAEEHYIEAIRLAKPGLIVLAGFMRVIKPKFIEAFEGKIINIHPSLLPKYPGLCTQKRALEAGEKESGCTVHFVSNIVDGGKRIMQAVVPVLPGDNEASLATRILEKEHLILPKTIGLFAEGKIDYSTSEDKPIILKYL